ncbi:MAG: DUF3015 domain-containing protein [Nitrospira sp.]|jgi:hypothetical protein|nr:DUF3015 domain-containing protein [Nitrospira sp.]MDH4245908.1 DUF3015 domain-containing protein [Nitrospira sp.]MDH4356975.1 DUF3015 domain-containing protein [Nitrospira sp.]MDH5319239.1 DUF3015 domain-containing protein [Nitrospira sp.]
MRTILGCVLVGTMSMILVTTGCTVKATIKQITDTTSNITGTTFGQAWWNEDGQLKPDFKATAFVSLNQENLQQDLAAGRGEYLSSVSRLLGVPEEQQPVFFSTVQANYAETVGKDPAALLALLRDTSRPFLR